MRVLRRARLHKHKERIVQIVLKDGNIVKFDRAGGTYVVKEPGLIGKTMSGTGFYYLISKVVYVYATKSVLTTKDSLAGQRIVEVFYNKTRIFFDKECGKYDSERQVIAGRTIEGKEISLSVSNITAMYTIDAPPVSKEEYVQNPNQFVAEMMITSGKVSDVDDNGAKFVGQREVIVGTTSAGQFVETDVHEIVDAQVSRYDTGSSIVAFLGILAGAGLLFFGIALIAVSGQH